jgi:hypothetical protein
MTHFSIRALPVLFLGVALQSGCTSASFCECLTLRRTIEGLVQLREANWHDIHHEAIKKLWPHVPLLPCRKGPEVGLEAAAGYLATCCETCDLCGGIALDDRGGAAGFRQVDIWMSRQSLGSTTSLLRTLTTAALPASVTPRSSSHSESRILDGYTWVSDDVLFKMRVDAIASDGVWVGHFQVGSCSSEGPIEKWRVGPDRVIRVLDAKAEETPDRRAALSLSYTTECLLEDRDCYGAELDQLWPKLRSLAAARAITAIDIGIQDCVGRGTFFQVSRSTDGQWGDALWTPKTP